MRQHDEQAPATPTVGELMNTVLYAVAEDETVLIAWELLERSGVRQLPVVCPDGRCAGLLDRADLAVACAAPASALSNRWVRELLQGRLQATLHPEDTLRRAAMVMSGAKIDALPVVARHGVLVGVLTARDIVAAFAGHPELHEPADGGPEIPFPVIPGLPPRRRERGSAVP